MKRYIVFILWLVHFTLFGQDDESEKPKKFTLKGYVKEMASLNALGDSLMFQNLIHNRLNFAWYPNKHFTFYAEFRNRLITGDFVSEVPGYAELINSNNDYFDLSANLIESNNAVLNVMADRLYMQWAKNNWEIKAGRQRINWGVNLAWNPNDWFNAYSFYDFDYEERPGSDAVRIIHYTGAASSVEVASKFSRDIDHYVGAAMWKINKWNYDIQLLGGFAQGDLALGTGWAGNLGNAGFKGEFTYFHNVTQTTVNSSYDNMVLSAISADYSFPSSLYFNASIMYNSNGSLHPDFGFGTFLLRPGTVRDVSPYKWSSFLQSSYQISPLFYASIALIGYPGSDSFFVNPGLTISVKQNLDLDLIGQLFYGNDAQGDFSSILKAGYVRVKWSF
ncbi:MAG TPA: hypothetical protein VFW11_02825 [Cyclobacteriaceae bacterium]|nr:hypothetical protein [Cyclobacteriaceae bacterium]